MISRYLDKSVDNQNLVHEALSYSYKHHLGYFRKSGEPYFNHPMAVAEILLRDFKVTDSQLIAAAFLHDVVEDVPHITLLDIEGKFGKPVAELVDGCTKLILSRFDRATRSDLTHSKIFVSASRRLEVLMIKLADRLHNMRTLGSLPVAKRRRIALETLKVYAPLAAKLNLFPIKRHLYNLALTQLFPRKSKRILNLIRSLRSSDQVAEFQKSLEAALSVLPCPVSVRSRVKDLGPYYSQYRQTLNVSNAENRIDFTIILDTDDSLICYGGLGILNSEFTPVPKSIRDFIANQKPNGYQSLHVRINDKGDDYLIKIRIKEMDLAANSGMMYQWDPKKPAQESYWAEISDLLKSIGEYGGPAPQRKDLIRLSSGDEVFVLTPKGDIHYLPRGSNVLDFAYKIHSALGDYCSGAYINGRRVNQTQILSDGDVVKILSSETPLEADSDLESLCISPKARNAVNKLVQKRRQVYAEKIGKALLLQDIEHYGLSTQILEDETISLILNFLHIKDRNQLYIRIGQDSISTNVILYYLDHIKASSEMGQNPESRPGQRSLSAKQNLLLVSEFEKAVHKFSKCCNPYPGLENVLAALSERGVAFHRAECPNLAGNSEMKIEKLLRVKWDDKNQWPHPITFETQIIGATLQDIINRMAPIESELKIHNIKSTPKKRPQVPAVSVSISFQNLLDSRAFFQCFDVGTVAIKTYGRQ